jgi:alpha-tubulin suppressor-like RCC1 family protein
VNGKPVRRVGAVGSKIAIVMATVATVATVASPIAAISGRAGSQAILSQLATPKCGTQLFPSSAGQWVIPGAAVPVFSNGPKDEGTLKDCIAKVSKVGGTRAGGAWQSTELVNRLYLTKGWITKSWKGAAGTTFWADAPAAFKKEKSGSIAYLGPGDVIDAKVFRSGVADGGTVLIADVASRVSIGAAAANVRLVSQNSGFEKRSSPVQIGKLKNGTLTIKSADAAERLSVIGVIHSPQRSTSLRATGLASDSGTTSTQPGAISTTTSAHSQVSTAGAGYCALLPSGGVDCWGQDNVGQLGDGQILPFGAATAAPVVGTNGTGMLSGVASLVGSGQSYCAILTTSGVDCWGRGNDGNLGNGVIYDEAITRTPGSPFPVPVVDTSGSRTLTGVKSLEGDGSGFCALLTSGAVDCWGYSADGELGDGQINITGVSQSSPVPVQVVSTSGTGTLNGVVSLASDTTGYCVVLVSGDVDCWGSGYDGELGNGQFYSLAPEASTIPVQVVGVGGSGTLTNVASLLGEGPNGDGGHGGGSHSSARYCALLTTGGVDCWGDEQQGQLGDGSNEPSASPLPVVNTSNTGSLGGVDGLAGDGSSYCAQLVAGGVDCWGDGLDGELGDGNFYPTGSLVPVAVVSTSGPGQLSGVQRITGGGANYCALLTLGGVDCWGYGNEGELGNGQIYAMGHAVPVAVTDTTGAGTLSGVASLAGDGSGFCALLASKGVDCWGDGGSGELGDGVFYVYPTYPNQGSAIAVTAIGSN